jgi:hypothetical protein
LSRDAVECLQAARARAQSPSMSAYLEKIVEDLRAKADLGRGLPERSPEKGPHNCRLLARIIISA